MASRAERSSPYQGLLPFEEADARYFFGRERDIRIITANVRASRLTILYGASGVGKSSVVRAGVAHGLRSRAQAAVRAGEAPDIPVVFHDWQGEPVGEWTGDTSAQLKRALAEAVGAATGEPPALDPSAPLSSAIRRYGPLLRVERRIPELDGQVAEDQGKLLIVLDQFEESFLYPRKHGPGSFAHELAEAVADDRLPANFVISIRDDALSKLDEFKGIIPDLFGNLLRLRRLDRKSATDAIARPLDQYREEAAATGAPVDVEPPLVDALLDQLGADVATPKLAGGGAIKMGEGAADDYGIETPYLQMVLTRLWDRERQAGSSRLRLETFHEMGDVETIVSGHLNDHLDSLPAADQEVAAAIFYHLVTPSGAKITQKLRDLAEYTKRDRSEVERVVNRLERGDTRILRRVPGLPRDPGDPRVEIFHDVLAVAIDAWRRRFEEQRRAEAARLLADVTEGKRRLTRADITWVARRTKSAHADALRKLAGAEVLWVDDNPENNAWQRDTMGSLGLRFTTSRSTDEALQQLARRRYDLVISDMGRGTKKDAGLDLVRALRQRRDSPPIVIYSATRGPLPRQAIDEGAVRATSDPHELLRIVIETLKRQRMPKGDQ